MLVLKPFHVCSDVVSKEHEPFSHANSVAIRTTLTALIDFLAFL